MAQGQVSLENLLDFLVLCESSGFIEFKLPLEGLRANLESLWKQIFPSLTENQPSKSPSPAALLPSKPGSHSQQQLEGEDFTVEQEVQETEFEASSLFDIKTPELVNTPDGDHLRQPALNVNSSDSHDQRFWTPCGHVASGDQESVTTANTECLPEEEDSASALNNPQSGSPAIEPTESEEGLEVPSRMSDSTAADRVFDSRPPPFTLDTDSEGSDCDADSSSEDVHKKTQEHSHSKSTLDDYTGSSTHISESPTGLEQRAREEGLEDDPINTGSDSPQRLVAEEKEAAPALHFQKNSKERSPFVIVNSDSSDDDDDDEADQKLESMFADLRLASAKKSVPKCIPSRKSLAVFIVSDSEDVDGGIISEDEDNSSSKENVSPPGVAHTRTPPSLTTPVYSTPYTPYTGVVFWGSPGEGAASTTSVTPAHKMCTPFVERNQSHATLGSTLASGSQPPVVTPSASKNFSRFKNDMTRELYKLFNTTVFENKLPVDLEIKWNNKLRTTAGYCYYLGFGRAKTARIELSTKVCDSYNRIRDTLIHELCHAATWVIDGVKGGGHGRQWKAWAQKANTAHPDLKPVTRCHNFEIAYKHTYKCTVCDFKIGRHSKSVNIKNTQCPYCLSKLELIPKLKADGTPAVKKVNQFAQFVKDNYSTVKSRSPWRNHKQVMERLKDKYHCSKVLDGSFSD